jgi:hypothetical protein
MVALAATLYIKQADAACIVMCAAAVERAANHWLSENNDRAGTENPDLTLNKCLVTLARRHIGDRELEKRCHGLKRTRNDIVHFRRSS